MITKAASGAIRPGAKREGALALYDVAGEYDLVDLGEVFMLVYWKPVSVDFWIITM